MDESTAFDGMESRKRPHGRRRRTRDIPVCLALLATAAALAGCHERRDCVDRAGHKVDDTYCNGAASRTYPYYFLYGGRGGRNLGNTITGGSTTRSLFRGGGTIRGGFGGAFGGDGEGGGE